MNNANSLVQRLEELNVTPLIYRPKGIRYVTVCLLLNGKKKVMARGLSVQSPLDVYDWHRGHNSACGRAIKAMFHKKTEKNPVNLMQRDDPRLPILVYTDNKVHLVKVLDAGFMFKSEYLPKVTEAEKVLVKNFNPKYKKG